MKLYQQQFIEFMFNRKILQFGKFILKSGCESPYFFNIGLFNTGRDLKLLGNFYAKALMSSGIDYNLLFGPAYKGIPIVISTTISLDEHYKRNVSYCFNRKEIKNHGEGDSLVGNSLKGKVILVDDVITSGATIHESVKFIQNNGAKLVGVLIALDRQEDICKATSVVYNIESCYNCKVISIITMQDIISFLEKKPEMSNYLRIIVEYRKSLSI